MITAVGLGPLVSDDLPLPWMTTTAAGLRPEDIVRVATATDTVIGAPVATTTMTGPAIDPPLDGPWMITLPRLHGAATMTLTAATTRLPPTLTPMAGPTTALIETSHPLLRPIAMSDIPVIRTLVSTIVVAVTGKSIPCIHSARTLPSVGITP